MSVGTPIRTHLHYVAFRMEIVQACINRRAYQHKSKKWQQTFRFSEGSAWVSNTSTFELLNTSSTCTCT